MRLSYRRLLKRFALVRSAGYQAGIIAAQTSFSAIEIARNQSEAGIAAEINMELGANDGVTVSAPPKNITPVLERGPANSFSQA